MGTKGHRPLLMFMHIHMCYSAGWCHRGRVGSACQASGHRLAIALVLATLLYSRSAKEALTGAAPFLTRGADATHLRGG